MFNTPSDYVKLVGCIIIGNLGTMFAMNLILRWYLYSKGIGF